MNDSSDFTSNDVEDSPQYSTFKDCLAHALISKISSSSSSSSKKTKGAKAETETADDLASDLDEFITYLTSELWSSFPESFRSLSPPTTSDSTTTSSTSGSTVESTLPSLDTIPHSVPDTLVSYSYLEDTESALKFLGNMFQTYADEATKPLPPWKSTRTACCEICDRNVPLTYHHLIPRSTHTKVLKRKWHDESMLNSVAWLCRHCHSAVHRFAPNEDLARYYYTVDLLMEREEMVRWSNYVSKQRWGERPKRAIRPPPT